MADASCTHTEELSCLSARPCNLTMMDAPNGTLQIGTLLDQQKSVVASDHLLLVAVHNTNKCINISGQG